MKEFLKWLTFVPKIIDAIIYIKDAWSASKSTKTVSEIRSEKKKVKSGSSTKN